jgi:hypothetical protein
MGREELPRNNKSGGCNCISNKEIGRQQGREDKRGHWGEDTKSAKNY